MSDMQSPLTEADYRDARGVLHRVLVPIDGSASPDEGIPVSLDISALYSEMPDRFVAALTEALWSVGLVTPRDYVAPGAMEKARAALLSVVKRDALDLQALAIEEIKKHA